jgi:hypothetical protein
MTIEGVSISENCAAANMNDVVRRMAVALKNFSLTVVSPSGSYMPLTGGAFTGTITRSGAGAYWYHASSSQTSGAVYVQTAATALPSPAEGVVVLQY